MLARHAAAEPISRAAQPKHDPVWDGALRGALIGAAGGAVTALITYGRGDGEWADRPVYMAGMTFWGAVIGGAAGLAVDLLRR
jgi:hypothetical protein